MAITTLVNASRTARSHSRVAAVRLGYQDKRFGNFIVAENDSTLEGVVLGALKRNNATLTRVEAFSSGQIAGRLAHLPGAETVLRRGVVARQNEDICAAVGLDRNALKDGISREAAEMVARAAQKQTGATYALAVLVNVDEGGDRVEFAGTTCLAIATANDLASQPHRRRPRLGAVGRRGNGA